MNNNNKKIVKIVSELTGFCHHYGSNDVTTHSQTTSNSIEISLTAKNLTQLDDALIKKIRDRLSSPRCNEIEEYYWGLSGEDDTDPELILVGMMIDSYTLNYDKENDILSIHLTRHI
ncbi:hypothetical protein SAMN02745248_02778 [Hathewaya proteolytica DSM 3090]|uniref:Uncharacterized protein n=1 Tax=Hathewaya proteolytica DSM 3090 TaxID=1121331 RepID=A0A1M6TBB1_9CLOT|nr:hypothetical protein [Hathewaya proteolytica]SHK54283.1 hypothetical protein SAMN02745248_02778 [Hathewaya proteolytica DSM 3090]